MRNRAALLVSSLLVTVAYAASGQEGRGEPGKPPPQPAAPAPKKADGARGKGADKSGASKAADKEKLPKELYATFVTSQGKIGVRLFPEQKPLAVKNFVELAEGKKEWTDPRTGQKTKKPIYDGTVFHRVIPNFMIQGGDPLGLGVGGPGYKLPDEIDPAERPFEKPCQLAYANSGPDTNGSQFFITEVPTPHLNPQKCQHDNPTAPGVCGYVRIGEGVCGCDLVGKLARGGNSTTTLNRVIITRSKPSCG